MAGRGSTKESRRQFEIDPSVENGERYSSAKKKAKWKVKKAKEEALDDLYEELSQQPDIARKKIYSIAKTRQRSREDNITSPFVNDESGKLQVVGEDVKGRWKEYFEKLLNEENPFTAQLPHHDPISTPQPDISQAEVEKALKKMKGGKAVGPDGVAADMVKALDDVGVRWLTRVIQAVWRDKKIPDEWKESVMVPIFKKKGNIHECGNYRGIKLLSHCMKIMERIIDARIREIVEHQLGEEQFGFRKGVGTTDPLFIIRQIIERKGEVQQDSMWAFIDLEKAYDKVARKLIRPVLGQYGVPEDLIEMVMAFYKDPTTRVRTCFGTTEAFEVRVGLHQGSALSPLIFIIILDYISKKNQAERGGKLIYADDIALHCSSEDELRMKVNGWYQELSSHGMKMSIKKTEVMLVSALGTNQQMGIEVGGKVLKQVDTFKYLGSWIEKSGGLEREIQARLQSASGAWQKVCGVAMDKRIPLKLRSLIYKSNVRPALLYGAEAWAVKEAHIRRLETAEMKYLRATRGVSLFDHMRNDDIRQEVGVIGIREKVQESRLRWYGHVQRMDDQSLVRWAMEMKVDGRRRRGRPKKRWKDNIKEDGRQVDLSVANDRKAWRAMTRRPDPDMG